MIVLYLNFKKKQESRAATNPKHNNMSLLDRVWQVLGSSDQTDDCVPLVEKDLSGKVKIAADDTKSGTVHNVEIEENTIELQVQTRLSRKYIMK